MKRVPIRWLALRAAALAFVSAGALAQAPQTRTVPVYDPTQIAFDRYTIVERLGITGWGSAFRIGGHPDLESAQRALLTRAAQLDADGVINLICFDQTDRIFNPKGYFCYGNAIKLKKK